MAFGMVLVLDIMIGAMIVLEMMPDYINVWESDMWGIMTLPSLGLSLYWLLCFSFTANYRTRRADSGDDRAEIKITSK